MEPNGLHKVSNRNFALISDPHKHVYSEHFEHLKKSVTPTV